MSATLSIKTTLTIIRVCISWNPPLLWVGLYALCRAFGDSRKPSADGVRHRIRPATMEMSQSSHVVPVSPSNVYRLPDVQLLGVLSTSCRRLHDALSCYRYHDDINKEEFI